MYYTISKSAGAAALSADGHYIEFLTAIRGEGPVYTQTHSRAFSDVEYSIPQMEGILVGCIAQRLNRGFKFDPATKQVVGDETASRLLKGSEGTPRRGWEEFYKV